MDIQKSFLESLKQQLPGNQSLGEALAETLHLTMDAAYRRIRGDTKLSLEEAVSLANAYHLTLEEIKDQKSDKTLFTFKPVTEGEFEYDEMLRETGRMMHEVAQHKDALVMYSAREIPLFYNLLYPHLGLFKYFVWQKSLLEHPEYKELKFNMLHFEHESQSPAKAITEIYDHIPSLEIWHPDTLQWTLQQLEYYVIAGYFENPEDSFIILDELEHQLRTVETNAEKGYKEKTGAPYTLYLNEIVPTDNAILAKTPDKSYSFIVPGPIGLFYTTEPRYNAFTERWMRVVTERSALISGSNEKLRKVYFGSMYLRIRQTRNKLKGVFS